MEFSCEEFESHPGVPLSRHLRQVGEACERVLSELGAPPDLVKAAALIGKTHDFGKYSPFFQEHLHKCGGGCRRRELHSHSPISALYAAWASLNLFNNPFLAVVAMLCVHAHHSNLTSIKKLQEVFEKIFGNLNYSSQLMAILRNRDKISMELRELSLPDVLAFGENFEKGLEEVGRALFEATRQKYNFANYDFANFYDVLLLFSALINSDKMSAAGVNTVSRRDLPADLVDRYIAEKFSRQRGKIAELREGIRCEAMASLENVLKNERLPRIITLTAPTGSGKTLLSLSVALKIREEVYRRTGLKPRIIYALPYINIINQTYDRFRDVLAAQGFGEEVDLLLKHHHLSIPSVEQLDERPLDELLLLTESWESEIVVTTFVQLLETLLGTSNRMLKKFHKLFNAIIILDEVQTLPLEYWKLVKESLEGLVQHSNSYVIFMTATQPAIFRESREARELIGDSGKHLKSLNRVRYEYVDRDMTVQEAAELAVEKWRNNPSLMFVVNKISTSIQLYNAIKDRLQNYVPLSSNAEEALSDERSPVIAYLSTNIIPKERGWRVETLKRLLDEGRKVLLVSTQVVEAGVDLDFSLAIRDIGPVDSIIQVGGRCNREWKRPFGETYVVRLLDDKGQLDACTIYGHLTIKLAEDLLSKKRVFVESQVADVLDEYYKEVGERLQIETRDESLDVLKGIKSLDFDKLSKFKLIKDEPKASVFIEVNSEASRVLAEFRDLWAKRREEDSYEFRSRLRVARVSLEEYMVETFHAENLPTEVVAEGLDVRYVSSSSLSDYYEWETGLRRNSLQASFW